MKIVDNKKTSLKILNYLFVLLIGIGLLLPAFGVLDWASFNKDPWIQAIPQSLENLLVVLIAFLMGRVFRIKKITFKSVISFWLLGAVAMLLFTITSWIKAPNTFSLYSFGAFLFPFISAVSPLFSLFILGSFLAPLLCEIQAKLTSKNFNLIWGIITFLVFLFTAVFLPLPNNWQAVVLVVALGWGIKEKSFLDKIKPIWAGLFALILLALSISLTVSFNEAKLIASTKFSFNPALLISYASPVYIFVAALIERTFRPVFKNITINQLYFLTPLAIVGQYSLSPNLFFYNTTTHRFGISKLKLLVIMAGLLILSAVLVLAVKALILHTSFGKMISQSLDYASGKDLLKVALDVKHKICTFISNHKVSLWTWTYFIVLSTCCILLMADSGKIDNQSAWGILLGQDLFVPVLSAIFLFALFAIFNFIFTRYWTSVVLVTVLTLVWTIAEKEKLLLRGEPIYPSEIQEIANWKTLLPMVGMGLVIAAIIVIVVLVLITIFLEKKHPIKMGNFKQRLIWLIISIVVFLTPMGFNNKNNPLYYISRGFGNVITFSNPKGDLQKNGPVLTLLDYLNIEAMQKPEGYSIDKLNKIQQHYSVVAKQINKTRKNDISKQTVIFNLSESFVDPTDFPSVKLTGPDPVPYLHSLRKDITYGHMLSAGYGGGTANMEYEAMTGFNMANFKGQIMPYLQVLPKYSKYPNMGQRFNYASAIHPFYGTYYGRKSVYKKYQFNKFAYLGSKYKIYDQKKIGADWYMSDQTLYANGLKQINSVKSGQFINLISIQNHTPYNNWYGDSEYNKEIKLSLPLAKGITDTNFATYTKGAQYTDQAVKNFINQIDKINKPITFVFYGDHYPTIINQDEIKKYPIKLHATTYFIYSNKYARKHGAKAKISKANYVNTSDFISMTLEQTNSKVTTYQALLTKIHQDLPALTINYDGETGYELVNQKGHKVSSNTLTAHQRQLLRDYEMVQYDMSVDKGHLMNSKFYD